MSRLEKSFTIGKHTITQGGKPFVIAEMSGNHNQSLDRALAIVEAAAKSGAHALKLQTYTPDTMTLDIRGGAFEITDPASLWAGKNLYELYAEAATPYEWHAPIFERARTLGMIPFSTPFDESSVEFLETLGVELYKIASFENTDHPLLEVVAMTGKPVIMSTGAATVVQIAEAVEVLRKHGCKQLVLLKCTSNYPATPENTHLRTIPVMHEAFGCPVGLSDHTGGIGAAVAAVALGAPVVEKHFTLNRADGGVDSAFSLEPSELASLVVETERAWQALGEVHMGMTKGEEKSLIYKRSLYVAKPIAAGEEFTKENLRVVRPGDGLPPKWYKEVLGRRASESLAPGTPLRMEHWLG
jgi:N-acetylneuraminate synthase